MTREEAIEQLKINRPYAYTELREAVDMAVEALEFLEKYDAYWESVKYAGENGREVEIHRYGRVYRIREVAT